jgi:hypothetical protein
MDRPSGGVRMPLRAAAVLQQRAHPLVGADGASVHRAALSPK